MHDENALRQVVRDAIRAGRIPARRPIRTWAGMGEGRPCCICERPIADEVELELDFGGASQSGAPQDCRVHARCFEAWERERATN